MSAHPSEGPGQKLLKEIEELLQGPLEGLLGNAGEPLPRLYLDWHLFNPLLLEGGKDWQAHVTVSPPPLALSERKLAEDLRDFWGTKRDNSKYRDTEVCLLRNLPKVGVGMFVRSGFYPDFILWVRNLKTKATRVVFLDPHGLHHEGIQGNDRFEAIERLRALGRRGRFKAKNIGLDGFILAPAQTTPDRIPGAKRDELGRSGGQVPSAPAGRSLHRAHRGQRVGTDQLNGVSPARSLWAPLRRDRKTSGLRPRS